MCSNAAGQRPDDQDMYIPSTYELAPYDPDTAVVRLLAAWRADIDREPFAHQAALAQVADKWPAIIETIRVT